MNGTRNPDETAAPPETRSGWDRDIESIGPARGDYMPPPSRSAWQPPRFYRGRRWARRVALPVLGVLLVVGGVAFSRITGDGGLDGGGLGISGPGEVDVAEDLPLVMLFNTGTGLIKVERARLLDASGPMELLGIRSHLFPSEGLPGGGGRLDDPERTPNFPLGERNVIPVPTELSEDGSPVEGLQLLARLRLTAEGVGNVETVEVTYIADGRRHHKTFDVGVTFCASGDPEWHQSARCIPDPGAATHELG